MNLRRGGVANEAWFLLMQQPILTEGITAKSKLNSLVVDQPYNMGESHGTAHLITTVMGQLPDCFYH
jgi:hypothetical protein